MDLGKDMQQEANSGYLRDWSGSSQKNQEGEERVASNSEACQPQSADDLFSQVVQRQPDLGLAKKITGMLSAMNEDVVKEAQSSPRILNEKIKEALLVSPQNSNG